MLLTTCVFDAYGTLFDVNAAARIAANEPNRETFKEVWPSVSNQWRLKQLQYTWLRSMTHSYTDFWTVTKNSLDYALESHGLHENLELKEKRRRDRALKVIKQEEDKQRELEYIKIKEWEEKFDREQKAREHRENLREQRLRQKELERENSFKEKENVGSDNFSAGLEKFEVNTTKEN